MRFMKPLLAGAMLIALAAPALASAEPYFGDYGHDRYEGDRGYDRRDQDDRRFNSWSGRNRDYGYSGYGSGYYQGDRHDHWRMRHHWGWRSDW
jgi:hypothetical protein